jgi:hypothetical protein
MSDIHGKFETEKAESAKGPSRTFSREELLASHQAPPQVAHRGKLTRYGGYQGNKIPGVDQNQPLLPCGV